MSEEIHLAHSFPRNDEETVQIVLKAYKDRYYIDLRIWFRDEKGEPVPTKKGVTITAEQLDELQKGVEELYRLRDELRKKKRAVSPPEKGGAAAPKQTFTGRNEASRMTAKTGPSSKGITI
jgi:hypothetical protein